MKNMRKAVFRLMEKKVNRVSKEHFPRSNNAAQGGISLKITYPWSDVGSSQVKNNIQDHMKIPIGQTL